MTVLLAMLSIKLVTSTLVFKLFNHHGWSKKIMAGLVLVLWTPVVYAGAAMVI